MTTIELFWFLLKNLVFHPKCANKIVSKVDGAEFGPTLYDINSAIRVKNVNHAQELGFGQYLCEGEEDYYKNTIVLG